MVNYPVLHISWGRTRRECRTHSPRGDWGDKFQTPGRQTRRWPCDTSCPARTPCCRGTTPTRRKGDRPSCTVWGRGGGGGGKREYLELWHVLLIYLKMFRNISPAGAKCSGIFYPRVQNVPEYFTRGCIMFRNILPAGAKYFTRGCKIFHIPRVKYFGIFCTRM